MTTGPKTSVDDTRIADKRLVTVEHVLTNNPLTAKDRQTPAANTRSHGVQNFYALPHDAMAEPMNVEEPPPTLPQSSTSHAPAEAIAATGDATPRRSEFKYALTLFYSKSSKDAKTYIAYIGRYKKYKHLSNE